MYKIYQVEYGDTIDIIANKTGTTRENIENINGFTNDSDLKVGSLIVVPSYTNDFFNTYTVKSGDTIYKIAQKSNVAPDLILLLNGLNKNDYIYPNQEILIPRENIDIYITKEGDTFNDIALDLNMSAEKLNSENKRIYVLPDQLIVSKRRNN